MQLFVNTVSSNPLLLAAAQVEIFCSASFYQLQRQKDFSCSRCDRTGRGAHPASYPVVTEGPFPGTEARPVRDADHSPPSSAEVKNE
jgi:hypothetical protein